MVSGALGHQVDLVTAVSRALGRQVGSATAVSGALGCQVGSVFAGKAGRAGRKGRPGRQGQAYFGAGQVTQGSLGRQVGPGTTISAALGRQVGSGTAVSETLGSQVGPGTAILRIFCCFLAIFGSCAKPANPLKYRACRQKQRFSPLCCELSRWRAVPSKNDENALVSGARGRRGRTAIAILGAFGHQVGSGTTVSGALGSSWPWFGARQALKGCLKGSLRLLAP